MNDNDSENYEPVHRTKGSRIFSDAVGFKKLDPTMTPVRPSYSTDLSMPYWLRRKVERRLDKIHETAAAEGDGKCV